MKAIFFGVLFSVFIYGSASAASTFIEGLEDVPVMDGFVQIQNDNISFGNEESRFVEAYLEATGENMNFPDVERFYRDTLSQMGWAFKGKIEDSISFVRDNETMDIAIDRHSPLVVRITVKSQN